MPIARPLSKEQILEAQSKTKSNRAAARFLGVSWIHYKRYAKIYNHEDGRTLFEHHLNRSGKGIPKFLSSKGQVGNIVDIIEGRTPIEHFTPQKIREKLVAEGYLKEECYRCGFHERRVTDYKIPLIVHFFDGNKKNYAIKNLELLCYNCYYISVGNLFDVKHINHLEDYMPIPKTQEIDWSDIDGKFEEHFKKLGIMPKEKPVEGSEYISRLK